MVPLCGENPLVTVCELWTLHGQHGTRRPAHEGFGHTSTHEVRDSPSPMSAHDNKVIDVVVGVSKDGIDRRPTDQCMLCLQSLRGARGLNLVQPGFPPQAHLMSLLDLTQGEI